MRAIALLLVVLAGCGTSEEKFVPDYAANYCGRVMACVDQAELTFEGIGTEPECEAHYIDEVSAWQSSGVCKFRKKSAKDCLEAVAALACPDDGSLASMPVPAVCGLVYDSCGTPVEETPEDTSVAAE